MNFLESPLQSVALQAQGIAAPPSISDAVAAAAAGDSPATKRARRHTATVYHRTIEIEAMKGNATPEDILGGEIYAQGINLLDHLPSVQCAVPAINALQVAQALQPQFDLMREQFKAQFDQMNARFSNSFAERDIDELVPLLAIPPLPAAPGQHALPLSVPDIFPETKGALYMLPLAALNILPNYYSLPVAGSTDQKRARLARYLGLPPRR